MIAHKIIRYEAFLKQIFNKINSSMLQDQLHIQK